MATLMAKCGAFFSENMECRHISDMGGGFGMVAKKVLDEGEALCTIPPTLHLNSTVITSCSGAVLESLSSLEVMLVFLLYWRFSHLRCPALDGLRTMASPEVMRIIQLWANLLPPDTSCDPWGVNCATTDYYLFPRLVEKAHMEHSNMLARLDRVKKAQVLGPQEVSLSEFTWAHGMLMSRGFKYGEGGWCFLPWVDYYNHSDEPNAIFKQVPGAGYKFKTLRPIARGEQLMISYSECSDFEFQLWYGFTLCTRAPCGQEDKSWNEQEHHQENCYYSFSPFTDAHGKRPTDNAWAIELLRKNFGPDVPVPARWQKAAHDFGQCRLYRKDWAPNSELNKLARQIAKVANTDKKSVVRKLVEGELASAEANRSRRRKECAASSGAARSMCGASACCEDLLLGYLEDNDEDFDRSLYM